MALLDATSSLKYELLDTDLCQRIDVLRAGLTQLRDTIETHLRVNTDGILRSFRLNQPAEFPTLHALLDAGLRRTALAVLDEVQPLARALLLELPAAPDAE